MWTGRPHRTRHSSGLAWTFEELDALRAAPIPDPGAYASGDSPAEAVADAVSVLSVAGAGGPADAASDAAAVPSATPASSLPDGLSAREVKVLRLVAEGKRDADIAAALVISRHTVHRHISHILAKTGVSNRLEAAAYARRHGLLDGP